MFYNFGRPVSASYQYLKNCSSFSCLSIFVFGVIFLFVLTASTFVHASASACLERLIVRMAYVCWCRCKTLLT